MRKHFLLCLLACLGISSFGWSQDRFTLNGYVKDAENGETLIGAAVYIEELQTGITTNVYGFYTITVPADDYTLTVTYIGYNELQQRVKVSTDVSVDLEMLPEASELSTVVVEANSTREQVKSTQMSVDRITTKQAKILPALFGEVDIIKTLQLKPGVSNGGEGSSGLIVRGGGPDQNLIILDEAIVYNPNHLFGFFSTFNPDAVKDVQLYKGGFPAEYGGRLSSVIDVRLKDGNRKKFAGSGGLGIISSRLTLEGPIVKDQGSFIVSGRRTYVDIFTRAINRANSDNPDFEQIPDYFFYDLNTKLNYDLGEKDRLFISGYFGRDKFGFRDDGFNFDFDWGNTTATARWNHIYNPKMFSNTTFTFSDYNYLIDAAIDDFSFDVGSGIRDYNLKTDFYYSPTPEHNIRFGIGGVHHDFTVSRLEANNETEEEPLFASATNFTAQEFHAYFSDDWDISSRLRMNLGVRMTGFLNQSQFYWGAEPRVSARYSVTDNISLKGSYTRMYQYIHLVSNSGATLPTDVWYPSTPGVKPQIADQVAAGLTIAINDDLVFTNELYYKWLQRSLDFRDGADLFVNPNLEEEFVFGRGYAYGNEIYLEKTKGKLTGWIGYTLAWSWREFPDISNGERFRPRFDRRHDISIVAIWELSRKLSLTGTWVYNTGQAYTLPTGWTLLQDTPGQEPQTVVLYTDRNQERQPSYHRLDIGLVWKFYPRWGESDLTIGFYNAYDRRNPYFIFFDVIENPDTGIPEEIQPTQVSLFPVLPSITYNFKF